MEGRPIKIRVRRKRGMLEVITYSQGARGAKRIRGRVLVEPGKLGEALSDPDTLIKLGVSKQTTAKF